jgi:hypothetical protein
MTLYIQSFRTYSTIDEVDEEGCAIPLGEQCQNALDSLKRYLLNPPVLAAPVKGHPLI